MDSAALPTHSGRVSRLKKRFFDVLSGSVKIEPRGVTLFLDGLCAQEDPVICLHAIVGSLHGLSSVQFAMQVDLSVRFMNGLGLAVLEYLLRTSDIGGDTLDVLLFHVVYPPIFWDPFVHAFQRGELNEDTQLIFARLLCRLLTLQNLDTTPYRLVASQTCVQNSFNSSPKREIREVGHLIKHFLSILELDSDISLSSLDGPGGRHDNDLVDYRAIAILPTADEILCRKPPFIRPVFQDESRTPQGLVDEYLDNTFRLLREDMLFDIRESLQAAFRTKKRSRSLDVTAAWSIVGAHIATTGRNTRWGFKLRCGMDSGQLKETKDGADSPAWSSRDSKMLKDQSLVCLLSGQDVICFGTANRVDEFLTSKPPVIVIQIEGATNIRKMITALCAPEDTRLIQLNVPVFSFQPVLTTLQNMHSIPLAEDILSWNPETPIATVQSGELLSQVAHAIASNFSVDLCTLLDLPTPIRLDKSQARSLVAGLTKRVSLIQGPPGTGKSFIGTILAKAIHDKTRQTILVVCFTNHALDQFLGELLKYGVPAESIVRLGGRPSQSVEHLSLQKQPRMRFCSDWDTIEGLRMDSRICADELEAHFDTIVNINNRRSLLQFAMKDPEFSDAFLVPAETEDGMTLVGEDGKAINDMYLFSRWTRGLDAGVLSSGSLVQASARIWDMDYSARQQLLERWRNDLIVSIANSISKVGDQWNTLQEGIKQEFGMSTITTLRQKRIIACTTTGAAIFAKAIKQVGPEVLLVEEAGEILESHILTALSSKVERMILIGDHKQLRPKVSNYQLTVEKGDGFDLNRSLFERLVLKGYPHETLSTQHRMRPEISAFVRELTYPDLTDASATHQRPNIRGVQSNIVFIDHTHPEDDESLIGDRADGGAKTSKQNTHEVQIVLKIVCYLAQQGYNSDDIVVLTPYLGQLHHLRDALKQENDPVLNDLDSLDLAQAGLGSQAAPESKTRNGRGRIRLSTIDNYQGEESRIVIASLTRSNKSNAIGFMDSPQRLNVLLSRARDGLIVIGNSQTFLKSKKGGVLWRRFFTLLEKGGYIYEGFPVKCKSHPKYTALLKHASDFDDHCPDGGCTIACGFELTCGHQCQMKCHPPRGSERLSGLLLDPHDASQCKYKLRAPCSAGHHTLAWECRSGGPPAVCSPCVKEEERLEEIAREFLEQEQRRKDAEAEHQRRMAELEAELRATQVANELEQGPSKCVGTPPLHGGQDTKNVDETRTVELGKQEGKIRKKERVEKSGAKTEEMKKTVERRIREGKKAEKKRAREAGEAESTPEERKQREEESEQEKRTMGLQETSTLTRRRTEEHTNAQETDQIKSAGAHSAARRSHE